MNNFDDILNEYKKIYIDKIKILDNPNHFYEYILEKFKKSNDVCCACLYFGTGEKCKNIYNLIKKRKENDKKTLILVDKNRYINNRNAKELLNSYGIEECFSFYDKKSTFSRFLPNKINELLGVFHFKFYIFDDAVLLTGANIDDSYFTNRIDRYIIIENKELSNSLRHFIYNEILLKEVNINLNTTKSPNLINRSSFILKFDNKSEIDILSTIFSYHYDEITISTGYPNFTDKHLNIFKNLKTNLILEIPIFSNLRQTQNEYINKIIADNYLINVKRAVNTLKNSRFYENRNENMTFHAKGIWCFKKETTEHPEMCISIIGSTNFNSRSLYRDFETNFVICTVDKENIASLKNEIESIIYKCYPVDIENIEFRKTKIISKLVNVFGRGFF